MLFPRPPQVSPTPLKNSLLSGSTVLPPPEVLQFKLPVAGVIVVEIASSTKGIVISTTKYATIIIKIPIVAHPPQRVL